MRTLYTIYPRRKSIFWKLIISVILSKNMYMYVCPIPNGFGDRTASLSAVQELFIRKGYYLLFLIPVFIVQLTKLA
jgi:hypothetical protein